MGITNKQRGRQIFSGGVEVGARAYPADGAISPTGHTALLTKAAAAGAYSLAAPSRDGIELTAVNRTAFAHVITATGLIDDGTGAASKNTGTFAAFPGAVLALISAGGKWNVVTKSGVTVA